MSFIADRDGLYWMLRKKRWSVNINENRTKVCLCSDATLIHFNRDFARNVNDNDLQSCFMMF